MTVLSSGRAAGKDIEGLVTSKTVKDNGNNTFTITMETYTTGRIEGGQPMPCDIWLVLDQSTSMKYNFSGGTSGTTKQEALKTAVCNFIDQVSAKYSSTTDHRIGIITFAGPWTQSGSKRYVDFVTSWTFATSANASSVKSKVNALSLRTNQATYVNEGLATTRANIVKGGKIDTGYSGPNTNRNTVVVVFTDGCPSGDGNNGAFNYSIADGAFDYKVSGVSMGSANMLKQAGVTIFTVGIQSGANPNQYDLTIGSKPSTTESNAGPLCNRFLNYLSSNFTAENAPDMGITDGYVKSNYTRTNTDYYLTANNASDLDNIFKKISERVIVPAISLDAKTVMQDKVSPYFSLPSNTSGISFYTAAYNGSSFATRTAASGLTATISGDVLKVTGFDFDANCCTKDKKPDGTYGKKIIIEFNVTPKNGFLGGNGVPTNDNDNSGVYSPTEGLLENYVTQYPSGKGGVDVQLADLKLRVPTANVYENGDYGPSIAKTLEISSDGGSTYKKFDAWVASLADWQKQFVNSSSISPTFSNNSVSISLDPTFSGKYPAKTYSATATLNIYKPVLTFTDKTVASGTSVNASYYNSNNYQSSKTVWKCGSTASTSVTMIGSAPTITLTYDPASFTSPNEGGIKNVKVTVKTNNAASGATFAWVKDSQCPSSETAAPSGAQFRIHCTPGLADITITKTVNGSVNADEHFVFIVTGPNNYRARVDLLPNSSVTIKGLPLGEYTVMEETWSWAYTSTNPSSAKITQDISKNNTFTFKNAQKENAPLHDEAYKNNKFGSN